MELAMAPSRGTDVDAVLLHPPVASLFSAVEHAAGELHHLGDALGVDCTVLQLFDGWVRPYEGDGTRNEDWYGWSEPLLAPLSATVDAVRVNEVTNSPGVMGAPPASAVTFITDDGIHVVYAHVQSVLVAPGDLVEPGEPIARIGNNGVCRNPHVHVGAWRGDAPLQIRFDLVALGRLRVTGCEPASG
jgi:murein DD-endopeptidase MepM/ murein hydrolase activator NlpD